MEEAPPADSGQGRFSISLQISYVVILRPATLDPAAFTVGGRPKDLRLQHEEMCAARRESGRTAGLARRTRRTICGRESIIPAPL
jgi:hypothetical protein